MCRADRFQTLAPRRAINAAIIFALVASLGLPAVSVYGQAPRGSNTAGGPPPTTAAENQENSKNKKTLSGDREAKSPAASASGGSASGDGVLAIVNTEPITRRQVGSAAMLRYGSEIIDSMVDRYLVLQACKEKGITISTQDVQNEILRTAKKFGLSPDAYLKLLEEERDISPEQYSNDVVWPLLALRALVSDSVSISQEEFNQAFVAEFGASVKCRMIMMRDRAKLEEVLNRAKADPEQFGQLASQYSEDESSASVRGLIPPIRHHMGDPAIETLAFSLEENQISEIYPLGEEWVILQCVRKLDPTPPRDEAFPAIREQIVDRLRDDKIRTQANVLFNTLREQAKVVKVLGDPQLEPQYPGIAAIINGQKLTAAQATEEAIKRHGREILNGEINRRLLTQALKQAGREVTPADLDEEVARAAIAYGCVDPQGRADVAAWFAQVLQDPNRSIDQSIALYKQDAVWPSVALKKLIPPVAVSEEEISQAFDKNFGPRVEVLAIVLGDQRTAQRVWEQARANPTDQFFGELAAQYSIEPTSQSNFGKVPPIRRFGGQPLIEKESFAMKPGDLSSIIATGEKYIILRCQGQTQPLVSDPTAVRDELIREVTERKERIAMAAEFDRLKGSAQIDNFLEGTTQDGRVAQQPSAATPK